ncbi:hypothetical protein [Noviherbaspirillum soli]|uniref:hypothetical protein n=1 Tax=Noviherbaspirillum soli TaxID=1064518 RepID=UPI00188D2B68|nr:hypothetical protein [Noviherbaspirillum soli]
MLRQRGDAGHVAAYQYGVDAMRFQATLDVTCAQGIGFSVEQGAVVGHGGQDGLSEEASPGTAGTGRDSR